MIIQNGLNFDMIPNWHSIPSELYWKIVNTKNLLPGYNLLFKAFYEFPLEETRVVILGQDPYHTPGKPNGLAFGHNENYSEKPEGSLRNILEEVQTDTGNVITSLTLQHWADQRVLLLNTILTVLPGKPLSCKDWGWQPIIIDFLKNLDKICSNKVYMLWGNYAKSFQKHLDTNNNLILTAAHPSPFSAYRGFFGCKHFSKANKYLTNNNKRQIEW